MGKVRRRTNRLRMGALPPRYSFVLNPHVRERFTKCPSCDASTRIRKLPLVVHAEDPGGPRLLLLNKTCRLCLHCETLIVDRAELESVIIANGGSATVKPPAYVVLGTIDRRTWRRGLSGDAELPDIREHMADLKKYFEGRCRAGALGTVKSNGWLTFEWSQRAMVFWRARLIRER